MACGIFPTCWRSQASFPGTLPACIVQLILEVLLDNQPMGWKWVQHEWSLSSGHLLACFHSSASRHEAEAAPLPSQWHKAPAALDQWCSAKTQPSQSSQQCKTSAIPSQQCSVKPKLLQHSTTAQCGAITACTHRAFPDCSWSTLSSFSLCWWDIPAWPFVRQLLATWYLLPGILGENSTCDHGKRALHVQ